MKNLNGEPLKLTLEVDCDREQLLPVAEWFLNFVQYMKKYELLEEVLVFKEQSKIKLNKWHCSEK